MTPPSLKLQTFLAHAGIASRRQAELLISQGWVTVNGQPAHLGQRVTSEDAVTYRGRPVNNQSGNTYYLLNKPVGFVSTVKDENNRPTVLSLLPAQSSHSRLYPVGRLDIDSQGLLLITDDGDVAYRLTHPKFQVEKTYEVVLDRPPTRKAIDYLRRGVRLDDGLARPLALVAINSTTFHLTINEGRNRQVRRMWRRVGYEVLNLTRIAFGPFTLESLAGQSVVKLTGSQIQKLKDFVKMLK